MQSINIQNNINIISVIGIVALVAWLTLLSMFLVIAFRDIYTVLKNFNFRRAERCHWSSCGLYYHNEKDPESRDCLSRHVSRKKFDKLSKYGNQSGCRSSIQVREIDIKRKPAESYSTEYLETYNAFTVYQTWWKVIIIFAGIVVLITGVIGIQDAIKLIFS